MQLVIRKRRRFDFDKVKPGPLALPAPLPVASLTTALAVILSKKFVLNSVIGPMLVTIPAGLDCLTPAAVPFGSFGPYTPQMKS
jgi:hypothetical protein